MKNVVILIIGALLCLCSLIQTFWFYKGHSSWSGYALWMIGGGMIAYVLIPYFLRWIDV